MESELRPGCGGKGELDGGDSYCIAELTKEVERLRESLRELAATARSPCQVSGAWVADQIDFILAGKS